MVMDFFHYIEEVKYVHNCISVDFLMCFLHIPAMSDLQKNLHFQFNRRCICTCDMPKIYDSYRVALLAKINKSLLYIVMQLLIKGFAI